MRAVRQNRLRERQRMMTMSNSVRIGTECGALGTVIHMEEIEGDIIAWTDRKVRINITDIEWEN